MRLLLTANHTPFLHGGAQSHLAGLQQALQTAGHEVSTLLLPFTFAPPSSIDDLMTYVKRLDWQAPNGQQIDRVISLQFPGYGLAHPHHVAWVMHQHRAVYDLYDAQQAGPEQQALKAAIERFDQEALTRVRHVFANSQNVAKRLKTYNGIDAEVLYHPPPQAEACYTREALPYIYFPSRIESLKRQTLLLEAVALMQEPLYVLFSGTGGQSAALEARIVALGLQERVRSLGYVSEAEKFAYYAHAAAIAYPVQDEDYGYVTLEAMLSAKAVLACTDSGGPLEWLEDGLTGWLCEPTPQALADRLDWISSHPAQVAMMGRLAQEAYVARAPSWNHVVERLLTP